MLISLILLLAVVLRAAAVFSSQSLWGDEWASLAMAGGSFGQTLQNAIGDVHPPLYFWVLHATTRIFGDGEWAIRLPSIVAGVLTVLVVYRLGREILSERSAILAALAVSVSPFFLQASHEVRGYSLAVCLSWAALWMGVRAFRRGRVRDWTAYTLFSLLSVYTEHYAWLPVGIFFAVCVYARKARVGKPENLPAWPWVTIAAAGLLPCLALIGYQAAGSEQMLKGAWILEHFEPFTWAKKLFGLLVHFSEGYLFAHLTNIQLVELLASPVVPLFLLAGTVPPLVWVLAALLDRKAEDLRARRFLGLLWAVPIATILFLYPARFSARYLIVSAPAFILLAAQGLSDRWGRWVHAGLLGAYGSVVILSLTNFYGLQTDVIHREDWKATLRFLSRNAEKRDLLVGISQPYDYYHRHGGIQVKGRFVDGLTEAAGCCAESQIQGSVWVVLLGNKDEAINQRMATELADRARRLGLYPASSTVRFGGERGLVHLFKFGWHPGSISVWPSVQWNEGPHVF